MSNILRISVTACNAKSYFILFTEMLIFSKIIACDVQITRKVTDRYYDLKIKDQGQIYLEFLWLATQIPLVFFDEVLSIITMIANMTFESNAKVNYI